MRCGFTFGSSTTWCRRASGAPAFFASAESQRVHRFAATAISVSTCSGGRRARFIPLCPGWPPGPRPDGSDLRGGVPGGSDEGGFDELREVCRSRTSSSSIFASCSAISTPDRLDRYRPWSPRPLCRAAHEGPWRSAARCDQSPPGPGNSNWRYRSTSPPHRVPRAPWQWPLPRKDDPRRTGTSPPGRWMRPADHQRRVNAFACAASRAAPATGQSRVARAPWCVPDPAKGAGAPRHARVSGRTMCPRPYPTLLRSAP